MAHEVQTEELFAACRTAMASAYAPYSKFHVGAALRAADGRVFTGVNVENSSYGLTMCAERVALGAAVAAGSRHFTHVAITCGTGHFLTPCGACRQVMAEFAPGLVVLILEGTGKVHELSLASLLPHAFSKADLLA